MNPDGEHGAGGPDPHNTVEVFRKHSPQMLRFALPRLGNSLADAEDRVQDTYLKREKYLLDGNTIENEAGFLYNTLRWLIADHWRRKGRQKELFADREIHENDSLPNREGDPATDEELSEAIAELPKRQQEIIDMIFLQGLTGNEVANKMGTSAATVSRLKNLALDNLQNRLYES